MIAAKKFKIKDNYLCACTGVLLGSEVWVNIAYSINGQIKWYTSAKRILVPEELENDFAMKLHTLENL